jgi:hypothetical protein
MPTVNNTRRLRGIAARSCGVLGVLLIVIGGLLGYATRVVFDSDAFADRAAASLADPRVASFVATKVTDAVIDQQRDLTSFRPILLATTEGIVGSAPFRAILRHSLRETHGLVLTEGGHDVLLTVSDIGIILKSALAPRPEIAEKLPEDVLAVLAAVDDTPLGPRLVQVLRFGQRTALKAQVAFFLGILLLGFGVILAIDRRVALLRTGIGLAGAGALVFLVARLGGPAIELVGSEPATRAVLAGLWDAFTAGLRSRGLALGVVGLLVAAAATSLVQQFDFRTAAQTARGVLWGPLASGRSRLIRAAAAIVVGGLAIVRPEITLQLLMLVAGSIVLFMGLTDLFSEVLPELPFIEEAKRPEPERRRGRVRVALAGTVIVAVIAIAAAALTRSPVATAAPWSVATCNGLVELCDQPLDQVSFPGAHNAMSAAENPGWMFANHELGPSAQLRDGIRAFLIDVYPGVPAGDRVKTDIEEGELVREKYEEILGAEGFDAAIRIRDRLISEQEGDAALYLCHGLCELGALPLVPTLEAMREFLVLNPNEVLVIIIEDAVTPAQIDSAFHESELIDYVYRGRAAPPWPTLRQMIRSGKRVLVLAEKDSQGVDWYHPAFEVFQETPYSFHDPAEFSCAANRGGTSGSLFLMNHWISTPPSSVPSDAEIVNAYEPLLARAQQCWSERGQIPNVVAVDFYRTGDLFDVVQTLNQTAGTRQP